MSLARDAPDRAHVEEMQWEAVRNLSQDNKRGSSFVVLNVAQ